MSVPFTDTHVQRRYDVVQALARGNLVISEACFDVSAKTVTGQRLRKSARNKLRI
jgi:hypothetical protein